MPTTRHYLQSSNYSNLTTIRTSPDRFGPNRWDRFLYGSRLASALGLWPWCDVFMSSETDNLLAGRLDAAPWFARQSGSGKTLEQALDGRLAQYLQTFLVACVWPNESQILADRTRE